MMIDSIVPEHLMGPASLILIFLAATVIGYLLIKQVPSLLHTPLMSGMNALSGITVLGALTVFVVLLRDNHPYVAFIFGGLAIILATVNVVAGFGVTGRMLRMFRKKEDRK